MSREYAVAATVRFSPVPSAVELAAAHWSIDPDMVRVEGRRRRSLRWIGLSTHDARDLVMDRSWWYATKLAAVIMTASITAYLTHLAL